MNSPLILPSQNEENVKILDPNEIPLLRMPKLELNTTYISKEKVYYATKESACFDIYADIEGVEVLNTAENITLNTGLYLRSQYRYFNFPKELFRLVLKICPRSGLAVKFGIDTMAGEVDADYIDKEIKVILRNDGNKPFTIQSGDKIAQARWTLCMTAFGDVEIKDVVREGGFGSTESK